MFPLFVELSSGSSVVSSSETLISAKSKAMKRGNTRVALLNGEGYMERVWSKTGRKWIEFIPGKIKPNGV